MNNEPNQFNQTFDDAQEPVVAPTPQPAPTTPAPEQAPAPTPTPAAQPVAPAPHGPTNGLAIAALVVGIVAVLLCWVPILGFFAGVAAVVLGIIGIRKAGGKGLAIAGIITGGMSLLIGIFFTIVALTTLVGISDVVKEATGGASKLQDAVNDIDKEQQQALDAKKDFAKGETALFGDIEVKVNSVQRDYQSTSKYTQPEAGKEYIVLNITVKNMSEEDKYFTGYVYDINDNGQVVEASYVPGLKDIASGTLTMNGGEITGDIGYEVTKGATNLKLQKTEMLYFINEGSTKEITYTLAF